MPSIPGATTTILLHNFKKLADKKLDLIIGPVEDEDITLVAQFAKKHDINVVNPFAVKNTEAERNEKVFQCNIPHENLYTQSREKILSEIGNRYVVFVIDDSGKENGKNGYLDLIKRSLLQQERDFVEISLGQDPYMETFSEMVPQATDIMFLSNASSRSSVGKVLAPPLQTQRGETLSQHFTIRLSRMATLHQRIYQSVPPTQHHLLFPFLHIAHRLGLDGNSRQISILVPSRYAAGQPATCTAGLRHGALLHDSPATVRTLLRP